MKNTLALLLVIGACGPGAVDPRQPTRTNAPLSLAADAHMVEIPDGSYISGSTPEERQQAYDDFLASSGKSTARDEQWFEAEDDRHNATLPTFRLDLMPVTNAEYAELVAAGRVAAPTMDEATWTQLGFSQPWSAVEKFVWQDGRPPAGREDHPVVLVSHDDAAAYCAWRGGEAGQPRRLPTADELEKATRGHDGLVYPWGNVWDASKLDSAAGGPGDTVAVGSYLDGASPYGVLDLAGNVFAWTSTPWKGKGQFTVKGSAWDDWGGVGRGASRHGRPATVRHVIVGFRCAADGGA
jgi:formylglycine-generating enzyme required for sulfatase activity